MRVVSRYIANKHNAGPKAKVDVERILSKNYGAKIYTNAAKLETKEGFFDKVNKYLFIRKALSTDDIVVIQIPFTNKVKFLNRAKNKIGIVHDIDGLRFNDMKLLGHEVNLLNTFKVLVVHNDKMKKALSDSGVNVPMVTLELFDYLVDFNYKKNTKNHNLTKPLTIVYPGNLEYRKAEFLYSLDSKKMKFIINAYGPCFEETANKKIIHKGSFSPDILPAKLEGDLGLVWSGKIDSSDESESEKGYNKYNAPHKLSSFIVAGLPVVVWSKSAVADTVLKYNIGYVIDELYDINNLDLHDYSIKQKNTLKLADKITKGYFTNHAFDEALKIMEDDNHEIK